MARLINKPNTIEGLLFRSEWEEFRRRAAHQLPFAAVEPAHAGERLCRARAGAGCLRARGRAEVSVFQLWGLHVSGLISHSSGQALGRLKDGRTAGWDKEDGRTRFVHAHPCAKNAQVAPSLVGIYGRTARLLDKIVLLF